MPCRAASAVCALALAAWAASRAAANDAVPAAAAGVPEQSAPPKVIVLRSGEVVEGAIRVTQGGYEVERNGGRIVLPADYAWVKARSRRDAYDQMRERLPHGTAAEHVALARWCIANRLYSCAQEELKVALTLEPDDAEARATLKRLDGVLRTGSAATGGAKPQAKAGPAAADTGHDAPGGPGPLATREFSARIQPLLVNRCGNAACHGTASTGAFRLQNVRLGNPSYRRLTEENLKAVLRQITPDPADSPLLVAPQQPGHGGARRPPFGGPGGDEQLKALTRWVAAASHSLPSPAGEAAPVEPPAVLLTSATDEKLDPPPADPAAADPDPPVTDSGDDPAGDLLRRTLAEERPDAFDPAEFNRRFGPQAGRPSSSPSEGPTP